MESNEFYIKKEANKLVLTIISKTQTSVELDMEDAADLALDIQKWIDTQINPESLNEAQRESYQQNLSKLKLEKEMKRMFVDIFDTEYLETKFAKTYKLDALNREIEITAKRLNELKNK